MYYMYYSFLNFFWRCLKICSISSSFIWRLPLHCFLLFAFRMRCFAFRITSIISWRNSVLFGTGKCRLSDTASVNKEIWKNYVFYIILHFIHTFLASTFKIKFTLNSGAKFCFEEGRNSFIFIPVESEAIHNFILNNFFYR